MIIEASAIKEGELPVNKIVHGNTLDVLRKLPSNSVDCIVTSPPYWSLRDYGVEGQIGLEPTLDEYLDKLLRVTKELKRILKPTGVMFWNHGDSFHNKCQTLQGTRLALKMIDEQGWILRNDIIWHKPNHMPESVKDRFTKAYEHVFMFVKKEKYWFDLDAVREPHKNFNPAGKGNKIRSGVYASQAHTHNMENHPLGKNPGDVWIINTEPFPEAHFAVMPTKLVKRCILAGCPEQICKKCGKPRKRIVEKEYLFRGGRYGRKIAEVNQVSETSIFRTDNLPLYYTVGWTDCGCNAGWKPGIVLDPFLGSGTTALVALKLNRQFVGIEINKEYCEMAYRRIKPYLNRITLETALKRI